MDICFLLSLYDCYDFFSQKVLRKCVAAANDVYFMRAIWRHCAHYVYYPSVSDTSCNKRRIHYFFLQSFVSEEFPHQIVSKKVKHEHYDDRQSFVFVCNIFLCLNIPLNVHFSVCCVIYGCLEEKSKSSHFVTEVMKSLLWGLPCI